MTDHQQQPTADDAIRYLLGRLEAAELLICELLAERLAQSTLPSSAHRAALTHLAAQWPQPTYVGPLDAAEKELRDDARRLCAAELIGRSVAMANDRSDFNAQVRRMNGDSRTVAAEAARMIERSDDGGVG